RGVGSDGGSLDAAPWQASTGQMASLLVTQISRHCWRPRLTACALGMPLAVACAGADSENGMSPSASASGSTAVSGIVEPPGSSTVVPSSNTHTVTSEQPERPGTSAPPSISPGVAPPGTSTQPGTPEPIETEPTPSGTTEPLGGDETTAGDTSDTEELADQDGGLGSNSTGPADAGTSSSNPTGDDVTDPVESTITPETEGGVNSSECPQSG